MVWNKMRNYLLRALLIVGLLCNGGLNACFAADSFPTLVTTKQGMLQGFHNSETTVAWYSVPFAKPPVGELRWRAPQPPDAWDGVREAATMCEPCTQKTSAPMDDDVKYLEISYSGTGESKIVGSEDCLYLNIYRPNTDAQNLPVLVFIHGGANMLGAIAMADGSDLAEKGNMVVVYVQYRLGPLGYFSHSVLRHGNSLEDDSGSYGTLDNIEALRWVRENISAFGGNPNNVTVGGESGGALNVTNLLISPLAKGLFHKAVVESPFPTFSQTRDEAELISNRLIELLLENDGYTIEEWRAWDETEKEAFLRSANSEDLVSTLMDNALMVQPIQSPGVIPGGITGILRSGNYNKVPVIFGTNKYEHKLWMGGTNAEMLHINGIKWADLPLVFTGEKTMDDIFPTQFDKDLYEITADYGSRACRTHAVDERARVMKAHQDDIYAYQFDFDFPEPFDFILGGAHASEVPFFYGLPERAPWDQWSPETDFPGGKELEKIMMTYLANFAATGNPNGENLPLWEEWSNAEDGPKVALLEGNSERANIRMSYDELFIRDVRVELRNIIAEWPPVKRRRYGIVPYMLPMAYMHLLPEQFVMDLGIHGEYAWDANYMMRKILFWSMTSGMLDARMP